MTAIPIKSDNKEIVSNLYGNAEYFALYDDRDDSFEIVKNEAKGDGLKTGEFIAHNGAKNTIYIHLGEGIFNYLIDQDINVFYLGKEELALKDAIKLFKEKRLTRVTKYNAKQHLSSGNCTCKKK
jgi:predicted Fe-Mo cluster-binding NifX family protein